MSIPSTSVDVMPVEVTLTTVPSTGTTLLPTESFRVTAQVMEPSSFSGMVALDLSLTGPSGSSTTLDLNDTMQASYSFDPPWRPGDYMLGASGANTVNIAPISFTVAAPTVSLTPQSLSPYFGTDLVVDVSATAEPYTDATVKVIATRTGPGSAVREERAITLATTNYQDRPVHLLQPTSWHIHNYGDDHRRCSRYDSRQRQRHCPACGGNAHHGALYRGDAVTHRELSCHRAGDGAIFLQWHGYAVSIPGWAQ